MLKALIVLALDAIVVGAAPQVFGINCGPVFGPICPFPVKFSYTCSCFDTKNETTFAAALCESNAGKSYLREFTDGTTPRERNVVS